MKRVFFVMTLMSCLCFIDCKKDNSVIINDEDAIDVWFEDIASNVKIVRLDSDEPIGSIKNIISYDNEIIAIGNDKQTAYYFVDGKLVSKMNHVGRGRGEYLDLSRYAYSPSRKVLYVLNGDKVLWYSMPEMNYSGSTPLKTNPNFISVHDDKSFFVAIVEDGKAITALVDIETGEITKQIDEISMYSLEQSDISMASYSMRDHYYSTSSFNNKIVAVNKDNTVTSLLTYNFGDKSIPEEYVDYDIKHLDRMFDIVEYMMENGDTRLEGNQFIRLRNDELTFWYYYSTHVWDRFLYRYNLKDKSGNSYKGFRIKGINRPIYPLSSTSEGYVTILEGDYSMYKTDEEPSDLANSIIHEMKKQEEHNPVLLFYDL